MSTFEIKMPKLGESITEGTIMSWSVKVGDMINEDDVLLEVTTAKVGAEIPSPVAGKVLQILYNEGDTVPIGTVIAIVQIEGEGNEEAPSPEKTVESVPAATPEKPAEVTAAPAPKIANEVAASAPATATVVSENVATNIDPGRWYSPVVLKLAQEANIPQEELNNIAGTGYQGRLSKKDIEHYIDQKKKGIIPSPVATTPEKKSEVSPAQPVASKVAAPVSPASTLSTTEGDQVVEMDYVRKLIADHMVLSKKTSPHVTSVLEVDVTKLVHWREKVKDEFLKREGIKLTFMPAIVEATAKALVEFPRINASVDGYKIILKKNINVGIAVSLSDGNLIVPVIHHADQLNLNGLAVSIESLAAKARSNKLSPDDIQGGTFTITNFGSFKTLFATPIINQPQVAILGVGYVEKKPAVIETPEGDVIAIRHKMYLSLSYDHRIVDGALGGSFLKRIADYLENWNKE